MPKVSIIIPNYNHSRYLNQRINSVLTQTYQDFEVIILDDCSTDNSREVIEQYRADLRVSKIVYNEVNSGGAFQQWEKGIELAKGEYVWIAESDDYCESTLLETLMDGLLANDKAVLAYVQSTVIDNYNKIDRITSHSVFSEYIVGSRYIPDYLAESCTICNASMAVFKKECYNHISPVFTTFKLCGDWAFWVEIARQGDVFVSGKLLNYFRKSEQGVSGKIFATGNNFVEEVRILTFLKGEALVSDNQFKHCLLYKYLRFNAHKSNYSDHVNTDIVQAFFHIENKSYSLFLKWHSYFTLLRIRLKRRLNLILKD
jgi:glycosyltransferase involved in cell wall biosynthesis